MHCVTAIGVRITVMKAYTMARGSVCSWSLAHQIKSVPPEVTTMVLVNPALKNYDCILRMNSIKDFGLVPNVSWSKVRTSSGATARLLSEDETARWSSAVLDGGI